MLPGGSGFDRNLCCNTQAWRGRAGRANGRHSAERGAKARRRSLDEDFDDLGGAGGGRGGGRRGAGRRGRGRGRPPGRGASSSSAAPAHIPLMLTDAEVRLMTS